MERKSWGKSPGEDLRLAFCDIFALQTSNSIMSILRPHTLPLRLVVGRSLAWRRSFSSSSRFSDKNRIYNSIRTPEELSTLLLLSASSNRPLITLWSASWCSTCAAVKPILRELIEDEGVGEAEGGIGYSEVELDSVLISNLGVKYMVMTLNFWSLLRNMLHWIGLILSIDQFNAYSPGI